MQLPVLLVLILALTSLPPSARSAEQSTEDAAPGRRHVVVAMNCAPDDSVAVQATLRTALALRHDDSEVTLFIDLEAIPLAEPRTAAQSQDLRRETDRLFGKLVAAGITVLVCPHCAEQQSLGPDRLRTGLRFTTVEEWDAVREQADQIYEYRAPRSKPPGETDSAENAIQA